MKKKILKKENTVRFQTKHKPPTRKKIDKPKYFDLISISIIVLLGSIIYSDSFNCSFIFDDFQVIVGNSKLYHLSDLKTIWNYENNRFIPNLTFAINYHFSQLNVWAYHLYNLIIHLINSILVWWLTILILSTPAVKNKIVIENKKSIAFITALLFVSHPLATESVTYIVQRIASLAALFYLFSIVLYIKARLFEKRNSIKYFLFAGCILSTILAMRSKENSYTIPFAIAMVELFFLQTKKLSINFKSFKIYLFITAFIGFVIIALITYTDSIFQTIPANATDDYKVITSANYLFTQFIVIPKYIQLLILPINLNFDYDVALSNNFFEIKTMLGFMFILLLIFLSIYMYNKNRIISFGILWFFLTIAIESSIIPISDLIFEHRTYLPSFGFFLILSTGIYQIIGISSHLKGIIMTILVVIILSNSYLTYARNLDWKDEFTMWNDVISKSPDKARPYNNRGVEYNSKKKYEEAIKDYKKAIELNPKWIAAYGNLGELLTKLNSNNEAMGYLNKAIILDSTSYTTYNNRGNVFLNLHKNKEAFDDYNKAIELDSNYAEGYSNRGNLLTKMLKYDEAFKDINKAIELDPTYPPAYLNRGCLLNNMMKRKEALVDINKAIELMNDYPEAYYNRGIVEMNLGDKANACTDWQKAMNSQYQPAKDYYNKYCK